MKAAILCFMLQFILVANAFSGNECPPSVSTQEQIAIPEKKEKPDDGRKRVPSGRYIGFYYDGISQNCEFAFPAGIDSISVIMEGNDGSLFFGTASVENPVWHVSLPTGEYHVVCNADNGSVYEGDVWID